MAAEGYQYLFFHRFTQLFLNEIPAVVSTSKVYNIFEFFKVTNIFNHITLNNWYNPTRIGYCNQ